MSHPQGDRGAAHSELDVGTRPAGVRAHAYPGWARVAAATLGALPWAGLLVILVVVVGADDPPPTPFDVLVLAAALVAAPALLAALLRLAFQAEVRVDATGDVEVARRDARFEIPAPLIAHATPWRVPLPAPGFTLVGRSGRALRGGRLALADPTTVLAPLADAGVGDADAAFHDPHVAWAEARATARGWGLARTLVKFPLFALLPATVLFNAHQWIAYGGTFGEWYLLGPGAWVRTALVHWATVTVYCVVWAALWRLVVEAPGFAATLLHPRRARAIRTLVERTCALLYWAGVPTVLALRFAPW